MEMSWFLVLCGPPEVVSSLNRWAGVMVITIIGDAGGLENDECLEKQNNYVSNWV